MVLKAVNLSWSNATVPHFCTIQTVMQKLLSLYIPTWCCISIIFSCSYCAVESSVTTTCCTLSFVKAVSSFSCLEIWRRWFLKECNAVKLHCFATSLVDMKYAVCCFTLTVQDLFAAVSYNHRLNTWHLLQLFMQFFCLFFLPMILFFLLLFFIL